MLVFKKIYLLLELKVVLKYDWKNFINFFYLGVFCFCKVIKDILASADKSEIFTCANLRQAIHHNYLLPPKIYINLYISNGI